MRELYSFRSVIQEVNALRRRAAIQVERLAFIALALLAVSFVVESLNYPIKMAGQGYTNVEILQFIVIGLWIIYRCLGTQDNGRSRNPPLWLALSVGLWVVILWLSAFSAPQYRDLAFAFNIRVVRGVVLAAVTFDLANSVRRWQVLIRCLALAGIVVFFFGLADAAGIAPVHDWLEDMRGASIYVGDLMRLSSTLSYPTIAAIVIELTLFPLLAWAVDTKRLWLRVTLGAAFLAGLAALVLTYSRGALVSFFVSLLAIAAVAMYYHNHGRQRRVILLGGTAIVATLAVVIGLLAIRNPIVALRFITEDDSSWYRAAFSVNSQLSGQPGETLTAPVTVTNTSERTWQAAGPQAFALGYHLLRVYPDLRLGVQYEGQRTALPTDIQPGQSVTVQAAVITPPEVGEYVIQWDMVEENVTWFSAKSGSMTETRVYLDGVTASDVPFVGVPYDDTLPELSPGRLTLWNIAFQIFRAHPVLGIGPDNFRLTYGPYLGTARWSTEIHANNVYIEWLADTGIVGLLSFLLMSVLLLRTVWRILKQNLENPVWVWQLALLGSLFAWYLHGFVDYFYEFTPTYTGWWLLVGMAVSMVAMERQPVQDVSKRDAT